MRLAQRHVPQPRGEEISGSLSAPATLALKPDMRRMEGVRLGAALSIKSIGHVSMQGRDYRKGE